MSDKHWHEVTPSAYAHEREALQYLRAKLPDHEPWRVWTNFMFTADDGSMNEVDALVLSPVGLFLVEIKSHPGAVRGSQDTLYFEGGGFKKHIDFEGGGFKKHIDHPRRLTNTKAKRLKSLLEKRARQKRTNLRVPRVEELVFLSHAVESHLAGPEAAHVTFRDESVPAAGVIGTLTKREGSRTRTSSGVRRRSALATTRSRPGSKTELPSTTSWGTTSPFPRCLIECVASGCLGEPTKSVSGSLPARGASTDC
jgi:hypothetical protein